MGTSRRFLTVPRIVALLVIVASCKGSLGGRLAACNHSKKQLENISNGGDRDDQ